MICNKCGNNIPDNSVFCGNCGNKISNNLFCSKCGSPISSTSTFCGNCGSSIILKENNDLSNNNQIQQSIQQPIQQQIQQPIQQPIQQSIIPTNNNVSNQKDNSKIFKGIIIGLLLIVIILLIVLLNQDDSSTTNNNNFDNKDKNRTIMIYMVGSNLESDLGIASADINSLDINKVDLNNINILLYTGGTKVWKNFAKNNENAIYQFTSNGFKKIKTMSLLNMGDANTLTDFLNYGYDNYKSDKYDVIFWDHGGAIQGAIYDDYTSDYLSLEDFSTAFKNSKFNSENKLESIIFRTCLNGTLEVATTFAPYAETLVASEEVTVGSATSRTFEFINTINLSDNNLSIGKKYIDSYVKWLDEIDPFDTVVETYSIIDLTKIQDLNNLLEDFSKSINIEEDYSLIARARNNIFQYGGEEGIDYDTIDLYSFINSIKSIDETKANKLLNKIEETILYSKTNENNSHGISIYMPYKGQEKVRNYFLTTVYPKLSDSPNYYNFIKSFDTKKNQSGSVTSSFSTFSSLNTNVDKTSNEFSIQLTEEQKNNFASASYIIFNKVEEGFIPIFTSSDYSLNDQGLLSTKLTDKLIKVKNKSDDISKAEYIFTFDEGNNTYTTYTTLEFFDEDAGAFLDYELYSATSTIKLDKDGKPYFASHTYTNKDDAGLVKTILDEKDFQLLIMHLPVYNILDKNGKYKESWETADRHYMIEEKINEYELLTSSMDIGEFYCIFKVSDTSNNYFYSNLTKIN